MTFPARSIASLGPCGGECGDSGCPAIMVTCDCGTCTHLVLAAAFAALTAEFAFTCDGCHSAHWLTISAAGPA